MTAYKKLDLAFSTSIFYPDFVVLLLSMALLSDYQIVGYDNNKLQYDNKARFMA